MAARNRETWSNGVLVSNGTYPITTEEQIWDSLRAKISAAIAANNAFLANAAPTNAQVVAYLRIVARELNGLARLAINQLDADDS